MQINPRDNVEINLENGHKYALCNISCGEHIIKYGQSIGHATCDIASGQHIHTHNMATNLSEQLFAYKYEPTFYALPETKVVPMIDAYIRPDGKIGIRNDVWIINTVGCVNKTAERLASLTGAKAFPHPFGCSQTGDDQTITQKVLAGLVNHPNAGGVLVLGLGCENNNIDIFKEFIGEYNPDRVRFLNVQDVEDEIDVGVKIIGELKDYASTFKRTKVSVAKLKIGLKCGGSDGYSGITANPLVGQVCEKHIACGGSCVLTEVPEMFGAEHLLMQRCESREVFDRYVNMINDFKSYYTEHSQKIYENPSPGNKAGGITTLEEKSLGCIQKGGLATVTDVLNYGDTVSKPGLSLLNGPGNDMVAITNLTAAGAHIILFTTGRGTPLGAPVPTMKIATNNQLATKKSNWIDFDASGILNGKKLDDALYEQIIRTASGEQTKNELNGYSEIAIFKDGVML